VKYIYLIVINTCLVVACNTDGVTDASTGEQNCEGDRPINVDGYFNSYQSPMLLQVSPDEISNSTIFEPISNRVELDNFRIGIGATYNLTVSSFAIAPIKYDYELGVRQAVCAPSLRTSVGPILTTIDVTANQAIIDELPEGSSLNEIVSIAIADRAADANFPPTMASVPQLLVQDAEYLTLQEFVDTNPIAPVAFFLRFDTQPQSNVPFSITLTYTLSNGLSGTVSTEEFSLM